MRQILDFGEVRRGLLGVTIQTIDKESAKALGTQVDHGALITGIEPGSAAEEAGLRVDDIITGIDDQRIDNNRELANAIGLKGSGDKVEIDYVRNGQRQTVLAELGQRLVQQIGGTNIHPGLKGAQFASASASSTRGIEVTDVESTARLLNATCEPVTSSQPSTVSPCRTCSNFVRSHPVIASCFCWCDEATVN